MFYRLLGWWDHTTFYLNKKVIYIGFGAAGLFMLSYFLPAMFTIGEVTLLLLTIAVLIDTFFLYRKRDGIGAKREVGERFSNGDDNLVTLKIINYYDYPVNGKVVDELPFQFQERNWERLVRIDASQHMELPYKLRPQERGSYEFGNINVYVQGPLTLVRRRFIFPQEQTVKVYPSYIQMRRYQLMAVSDNLQQAGMKRMRKLGHSMEFEQIKEYVRGDDYRTINWKATARHGDLMANNYTDERSQQIYCVINKGRVMRMPFEGMTLLDYAINAALVLCNTALQRQDRAGLITFAQQIDTFLPADKKPTQISQVLEALYRQETNFMEPDF